MQMIGTPVRLESEARPQERAWEVSARSAEGSHRQGSKGGYNPPLPHYSAYGRNTTSNVAKPTAIQVRSVMLSQRGQG